MYVVLVEFVVQPEHSLEFQRLVIANARTSRDQEPGCHQFDVAIEPAHPNRLVLYELYDDRAAFEAHLRAPHFLTFDATVKPWIVEKKVRTFLRVEPPLPDASP